MCGFSNAITFKAIDDDDINYVENFVKNDLVQYFVPRQLSIPKTHDNDDDDFADADLSEDEKHFFFGIYTSNPSNFVFLRGERKMLNALSEHVRSTEGTSVGLKHFQLNVDGIDKIKISWKGTFQSKVGMHFGDKKQYVKQKKVMPKKSAEDSKIDLFDKFQKFVRQNYKNMVSELSPDMVEIKILPDNGIDAKVQCVICLELGQTKRYSIFCQVSPTSKCWVFSNLKRHMDKHKKDNHHFDRDAENVPDDHNLSSNSGDDSGNSAEEGEDSTASQREDEKGIGHQDLIYTQLSVQNLMMKNAISMHKETTENITFNLSDIVDGSIGVTKMKTDGNCLFSALAHQLYCVKLNSEEHQNATKEVRQNSSTFIRENYALFANAIKGRIFDRLSKNKENIVKLKTGEIKIDQECSIFVNHCLPKQGFWGGFESLKAISQIYKINILVFSENSGYYFADRFNAGYDRSVFIAFRNVNELAENRAAADTEKNHYDSVVDVCSELISECSKGCAELLAKAECNAKSDSIVSLNDSVL